MTAPTWPAPMSSKGVDVRREGVDGSRYYADPTTAKLLASVTTVIGATTSMPWLTPWAAKLAAEAAVEHYAMVGELIKIGPDGAVDWIKGEAKRRREKASETGTWLHDVVEALALDASLPDMPDEVEPFAEAFVDWCIEWEPEFLMSECAVANPARGYAGTLDLVVRFPKWADSPELGGTWCLDVKSGANLSAYMPVQLEAYRRATEVWLPQGRKAAMPAVDRIGVLHVRPGGAKLLDVTEQGGDAAHHTFLRMLELLDWKDSQGGRMGRAIYLPDEHGQQPPPLLEDIDGVPAKAALAAAGVFRLDQLADLGADALAAIKGVGPGAVLDVETLLKEHGLNMDGLAEACQAIRDKQAKALERKQAKVAKEAGA